MNELNKIIQGDALKVLKTLPDESVDCVVTSPPYWALRDYGTSKWEGGKEDCDHKNGTLQSSKSTLHPHGENDKRTLEGMPYKEICGKCGSKRVDKQLGLETTFQEYINKLCNVFDEVKRVLKKEGTCFVNIGDTYGTSSGSGVRGGKQSTNRGTQNNKEWQEKGKQGIAGMEKSLLQIPSRFGIEMSNRGWILRNEIIWYKPNCMPSSADDRFTVDFEKVFFFVKNKKYSFQQQLEEATYTDNRLGKGNIRYNNRETNSGVTVTENRNKRTVWKVNTKGFEEAHFATYPEELIIPMIKAGCPRGGVCLDPFFGSGTTGSVALQLDCKYIGIEINPEYIKIAKDRIKPFENKLF